MQITAWAVDSKAFPAQSIEVSSARQECRVVAGRGEFGSEVGAHGSRAHHCDAHDRPLIRIKEALVVLHQKGLWDRSPHLSKMPWGNADHQLHRSA
jgi:hypothetical protein